MATKRILLLLDSDRHAFPLLHFLTSNAKVFQWKVRLASLSDPAVFDNIRSEPFADQIEFLDLKKYQECAQAIKKSDIVIAQVQDAQLLEIADTCIAHRKTLISPARLTRQMALKKAAAKENNTLILMDCGLAPGLDHVIAKKAIDNIHAKGGTISSFKTYSGVLLAETRDTNPWNFKMTEPVGDLLAWGKHTNRHLTNGAMQHIPCHRLFERAEPTTIRNIDDLVAIPEGDSLYYKKIYDLNDAHTVVKAKLARRGFQQLWNVLVGLGATDNNSRMDPAAVESYYAMVNCLLPLSSSRSIEERLQTYAGADESDIEKLRWLGLFDKTPWTDLKGEVTPAQMLQSLLQKKLGIVEGDRDCVVMEHQLGYEFRDEHYEMTASLVFEGDNERYSALAKVIGFICGAAAKSVLLGSIKIKGLHIPILREIYDPILNELEELDIAFHMTERKPVIGGDVFIADNN